MYLTCGVDRIEIDVSDKKYDYLLNPLRALGLLPETLPVPHYVIEQWTKWLQLHEDLAEITKTDYEPYFAIAQPIIKLQEVVGVVAFMGAPDRWEVAVEVDRSTSPPARRRHYLNCGSAVLSLGLLDLCDKSYWAPLFDLDFTQRILPMEYHYLPMEENIETLKAIEWYTVLVGIHHNSMLNATESVDTLGVTKVWGEILWEDVVDFVDAQWARPLLDSRMRVIDYSRDEEDSSDSDGDEEPNDEAILEVL